MDTVQVGHKYLIPIEGTCAWIRVVGPGGDPGFWLCEVSDTGNLVDVPGSVLEMNTEATKAPA